MPDKVQQIISGSIGFDDWEWGVDLFADDPVIFKKLIYEMRFDEVSGVFSNFGAFYVGLRCAASELSTLLEGKTPKALPKTRPVHAGPARRARSFQASAGRCLYFGLPAYAKLEMVPIWQSKRYNSVRFGAKRPADKASWSPRSITKFFRSLPCCAPPMSRLPTAETRRIKVSKTAQGLLLPGYVFTQDSNQEF